MAKSQFLEFSVNLANQAQVTALQASYPAGRRLSPTSASALYAAPFQLHDAPFSAPSLRSKWFGNAAKYPTTVESFTLCSGGWFGICFLFGNKTTYTWIARYVFVPPATPEIDGVPVVPVAIAQRRWIIGWQLPPDGENNRYGGGVTGYSVSREASRHPDGFGLALRNPAGDYTSPVLTHYGAVASPRSWERIYVRRRNTPTDAGTFWHATGTVSGLAGPVLAITATGAVALYNQDAVGVTTLLQTGPVLDVDRVYKLDLIFSFATGVNGAGAIFRLFINGAQAFTQGYATAVGLGQVQNHNYSRVGYTGGSFVSPSTLEIDIGEWINADWPLTDATGRFAGMDWLNGSKLQQVRGTGFGTGHSAGAWTGDYRTLLQNPVEGSVATMTSVVSAATLVLDTDAVRTVDGQVGGLGMAALLVGLYNGQLFGTDGLLGWRIAGGTIDLTSIDQTTGMGWNAVLYRPAGVVTPPPVAPLELRFVKAANIDSVTLRSLQGVAEILGVFGDEDVQPSSVGVPAAQKPRMGTHNAYYPTSVWARRGVAPQSPVVVVGATYVGNASGQDLAFRAPVHWFWGRRTTAGLNTSSTHWWSSMLGSHWGVQQSVEGSIVAQAGVDPSYLGGGDLNTAEQRVLIRLAGSATQVNVAGAVYQYITVSDPGMRFMLNGAFQHGAALGSAVNAVLNPAFTPLAGFLHPSDPTTNPAAAHYYKGPGHLTDFAQVLGAAEVGGVATFQAGEVTSKALLHILRANTAYSLWRLADGNGGAGVVVQILSYAGDATGARTVDLTPVSNRRPLFGLVLPHNAAALCRDPSNTGTTSNNAATGAENAATGIVGGGIDQILVESALNAAGVVYDVFVIPGGTAACNNGWSCNGEFFPVEPDSPADGPWDTPPETDPNPPAPPAPPICPTPVVPAAG